MTTGTLRELEWMPAIDQYMALAEAMHDERDDCNAGYDLPFSECAARDADIQDAISVLIALRKAEWQLRRVIAGTPEFGL